MVTFAQSRIIQTGWEEGYRQLSVQKAIAEAIARGAKEGKSYRESCDEVWMHVRGPPLAKMGFAASTAGLDHFMGLPRDYTDDEDGLAAVII